jgi:glycosyltransferase involved in cell wall biosynthesis
VRLAFVLPRYGREVVGGAESAVRMLAERLVADKGWQVEVLTTWARDSHTWAEAYPAGATQEAGVSITRFPAQGRDRRFDAAMAPLMGGATLDRVAEERLIELQGPVSPELVDAAASTPADLVAFSPYLYHPIVHGVPRLGQRAVLHPAAHDEPLLGLSIVGDVFREAGALVFYTDGERRLVERRLAVGTKPSLVLGLGVEPPPTRPDQDKARSALGLSPDEPYLVCVGRVDEAKGTGLLSRAFASYKRRRPGPLKLVFIGQVVDRPAPHPDVVVAGPVDEAVKWGAYAGAVALAQPSPYESFSLVLLEAWLAGAPALVNASCLATREHVSHSGGGLWFGSYGAFEAAVDRLADDPALRDRLAQRGRAYAEARFAWPALLDRYEQFMTSHALRARR